jgi:putative endonuclease
MAIASKAAISAGMTASMKAAMTPPPSGTGVEQRFLHGIDGLAAKLKRGSARSGSLPSHLLTGLRGEEEALFYLRRRGFTIVARRWQTPRLSGDVDLIAWDGSTLCFVEVKAQSGRGFVPAEFAVDQSKQQMLRSLAHVFCKRFPDHIRQQLPLRFDVVAVYLPNSAAGRPAAAEIEHFPAAFTL